MSRHLITLHSRDRAGAAVLNVRWRFYPFEVSPAWLTFTNGVYTVDELALPDEATMYSSADESDSGTVAQLFSGADGTPATHAYLPAGYYIAIGSIGTGSGARYWVVKDYVLGRSVATFEQLGAVGDGVTDDSDAFRAASGGEYHATPGKTYLISQSAYTDAIRLDSGTRWVMTGAKIQYAHFGWPLFYANLNADGVFLKDVHIVYNGQAAASAAALPSKPDMRDLYLIPSSSAVGYSCALVLAGAENVEVSGLKHEALSPGIHKSQYTIIRLDPKYDAARDLVDGLINSDRAEKIVLRNLDFNDYNMGVIGTGYRNIFVEGDIYFGRYESFFNDTTLDYGSPEHAFYLSGYLPIDNFSCGFIVDNGEDVSGNSAGPRSANCFKSRVIRGGSVAGIYSRRSHGLIDGEGYSDITFGPIVYRPRDSSDLGGSVVRFTEETQGANVTLTNTRLDLGTFSGDILSIKGVSGGTIDSIDLGDFSITQNLATSTNVLSTQISDVRLLRGRMKMDLSGAATGSFTISKIDDVTINRLEIELSKPSTQAFRVTGNAVGVNTVKVSSPHGPIYTSSQTDVTTMHGVYAVSRRLPRVSSATTGDFTFQLPHYGHYTVAVWLYGVSSSSISQVFDLIWTDAPAIEAVSERFATPPSSGNYTGVSAAVSGTGLLTITATSSVAMNLDADVSVHSASAFSGSP